MKTSLGSKTVQRSVTFLLPLVVFSSLSCSQNQQLDTGDIAIEVEIEEGLKDQLQIVSATGKKPGETNPVEARVELQNAGGSETRLVLDGAWLDKHGNFCGGNQVVIDLPAQQTHKLETGTRVQRATRFKLTVNRTEATQDELLTSILQDTRFTLAEDRGYGYTESPNTETIASWTARGLVDGEPFYVKTIIFSPINSQWTLQILDEPIDVLKGIAMARFDHPALQIININLPQEPQAGDVLQKKLSFGGGHFQVKRSPDSQTTTSWNADNAWVLEIEKWDTKPWVEGGDTFQQVGTASGRLYVAYKGSEYGLKDSWVSGTFEDAAIVYYGKPD